MNQQVHLDLLPIDSRRPARGGFFVWRTEKRKQKRVSLHPARSGAGAQTPKVPGAANASFRDSLSPVFAVVWMAAGAFAARRGDANPAVATIEHLAQSVGMLCQITLVVRRSHAA